MVALSHSSLKRATEYLPGAIYHRPPEDKPAADGSQCEGHRNTAQRSDQRARCKSASSAHLDRRGSTATSNRINWCSHSTPSPITGRSPSLASHWVPFTVPSRHTPP